MCSLKILLSFKKRFALRSPSLPFNQMLLMAFLTDFHVIRPSFESTHQETLDWIVDAHVKAEGHADPALFRQEIQEKLNRVGCKSPAIEKRGHSLPIFTIEIGKKCRFFVWTRSRRGLG